MTSVVGLFFQVVHGIKSVAQIYFNNLHWSIFMRAIERLCKLRKM